MRRRFLSDLNVNQSESKGVCCLEDNTILCMLLWLWLLVAAVAGGLWLLRVIAHYTPHTTRVPTNAHKARNTGKKGNGGCIKCPVPGRIPYEMRTSNLAAVFDIYVRWPLAVCVLFISKVRGGGGPWGGQDSYGWISFFGLPIKPYSGLRPLVYNI